MSYTYDDLKIEALIQGLSNERLSRYIQLAPQSKEKQLALYAWNTKLSESLYTPIQGLEVIARNYFHRSLSDCLGEEWYHHPKVSFAYSQARSLDQTKESLSKEGKKLIPSNLVAQFSFGFWTGVLGSKYENVFWRPCLHRAFTNKPSPFLRRQAHESFDLVRILRNRVAHHEPVLRPSLIEDYQRIIKMIGWFCQETASWIEKQSQFNQVWNLEINPFKF